MTLEELIGRPIPFADLLGIRILSIDPGIARLELPHRDELSNSHGGFHGGVVTALADVALALAAIAQNPHCKGAFTVDLSVSFVGPGSGTLVAEGRCLRAGRSLAFSEGEVRDAKGELVAKAIGSFKFKR